MYIQTVSVHRNKYCEVEQNKGNEKKFFVTIYDNLHKKGLKRAEGV
jgi:hypothetical protein